MIIPIIGDCHWGIRNDSDNFYNYFKRFFDDVLFPYIKENNIQHIIQTGDFLDKRKGVDYKTLNRVSIDFFERLRDLHCAVHTFPGNHDIYYRHSTKVNSITELFDWRKGVHIYNEPTTVKFDNLNIDFFPWITKENIDQVEKFVSKSSSSICVGHFEFSGFEVQAGLMSKHGMDTKLFDDYATVLSGHFHHRSTNGNIHYVGTPYEMTWADFADPKGFHVLNTDDQELTFIENPEKMFHKVFYDSTVDYNQYDFDELSDTIVKLIVKDREDISKFESVVAKINSVKPLNLTIVESDVAVVEGIDQETIEGVDTFNVLVAAARATAETEGLDPNKTEKIITELYQEAIDASREN